MSTARTCAAAPSTWTVSPGGPGRCSHRSCTASRPRTGPSPMSPSCPASTGGWAGRVGALAVTHGRGPALPAHDDRAVGQAPRAVPRRPAGRPAGQPARTAAPGRPRHRHRGHVAQPAEPARGRPGRRGTGRPARGDARRGPGSGCWPASSSSAARTWWRRCEPDDAADLLAEMPPEQRERLLTAMEAVQAADLRRLLRYDATTAGGLMTSQPLIVTPTHVSSRRCWPGSGTRRCRSPRLCRSTCASRP